MGTMRPWAKSSSLRQTYFGSSAQNTLTILDRCKIYRREAFIFRLPDELLLTILELATTSPRFPGSCCDSMTRCNYTAIKTLLFMCHRFYRIALPLLYRTIRFNDPHRAVPPTRAAKSLHRSLQKNPSLRQHCWVMSISIHVGEDTSELKVEDFSVAKDFVSCLTSVRCLHIDGGFGGKSNEHTWAFIRHIVRHVREVEHLRLSGHYRGLCLGPVMECIDIPSLRRLDVTEVSETKDGFVVLEPKKYRAASFSTLYLSYYGESPQATAQLLQWPNQISHFHFSSFWNNRFYMDLPMFHSMLLMHKDNLKTIDIGYLDPSGRGHPFIASDFPKLEVLRLSRWQMEENLEFSSTKADLLLAPNLKTFGWDFSHIAASESWTDFGNREEKWVRDLAQAAIVRKATLKKIEIIFNPDSCGSKVEDGYPWDRMDKIRDEIRPCGMALDYSEPPLSKASWLEQMSSEPAFKGRTIREYFSPARG